MKRLLIIGYCMLVTMYAGADEKKTPTFDDYFTDQTLRIDYIFAGDASHQHVFLDEMSSSSRWYGKRSRLADVPLKGNGQLIARSCDNGQVIYRHSFSTLFQEWLATDEAKHTSRSFENVFLMPMPQRPTEVTIELYDYHDSLTTTMTHTVDPSDILIRDHSRQSSVRYTTINAPADTSSCIHIAYVAEGYTAQQMSLFRQHCTEATEALFAHEPFKTMQGAFSIVAVESPSTDSGTSIPHKHEWRSTALASHFDTFYSNRYLTTLQLKRLHDTLTGVPYEHIIILVNTENYGGGGIFNSYNLSYTKGRSWKPVVVHEFGHSFAGLGDEYDYGDNDPMYFSDTEPWEPNLTTSTAKPVKWQTLIDKGRATLCEGGGYQSHGVWRGSPDCRMKTNEYPEFCPVCQEAITRLINFYVSR